MQHLPIHLAREAKLGGPVSFHWMYPIERTIGRYKHYVKNKARPEGSIAEAYLSNEALTLCSMYLGRAETVFNRPSRNENPEDGVGFTVFHQKVRLIGKCVTKMIDTDVAMYRKAQWYVLNKCEEVVDYLKEHRRGLEALGVSGNEIFKTHESLVCGASLMYNWRVELHPYTIVTLHA